MTGLEKGKSLQEWKTEMLMAMQSEIVNSKQGIKRKKFVALKAIKYGLNRKTIENYLSLLLDAEMIQEEDGLLKSVS